MRGVETSHMLSREFDENIEERVMFHGAHATMRVLRLFQQVNPQRGYQVPWRHSDRYKARKRQSE